MLLLLLAMTVAMMTITVAVVVVTGDDRRCVVVGIHFDRFGHVEILLRCQLGDRCSIVRFVIVIVVDIVGVLAGVIAVTSTQQYDNDDDRATDDDTDNDADDDLPRIIVRSRRARWNQILRRLSTIAAVITVVVARC